MNTMNHERKIYTERQISAALTVADFHSGLNRITPCMCDEAVKRLEGAPMSAVLASAYTESQRALHYAQGYKTDNMQHSIL